MNFLEIVEKACRQNIDCDADGNVDGHEFAAEQIIRDLGKAKYKVVSRYGKVVNLHELKRLSRNPL